MLKPALNIARFTLLEGWRTHALWGIVGVIIVALVAAEFAAGLAITESESYRVLIYASLVRALLVLIFMLLVATSVVRELHDRQLDFTLSRPVSRASWMVGRLLGFWILSAAAVGIAGLPLLWHGASSGAAAWLITFQLELAIVCAATMTCVVTLRQVTLAVTVAAGFYVLSRAIDMLVLMSRGPTVDPNAWVSQVVAEGIDGLALVLPALGRVAQSEWLSSGTVATPISGTVIECLVYSALLLAIGLFDFYRVDD